MRDSDRASAAALHKAAIAAFGPDVAFHLLSGRMPSSDAGVVSRGGRGVIATPLALFANSGGIVSPG